MGQGGQRALAQLNKFYSTIISGASNKGKSSLFRYCILQHLMQSPRGIDLLMCDPHYHAGDDSLASSLEPLSKLFLGEVASTDEDILAYAEYAVDIGQRRVNGDRGRRPTMLVIDEVSLLLDGSDIERPLGHCLKRIGREFRKVNVMAVIIGQQFGGNVIDTGTRNCFTRVLSCPNVKDNLGRMIPSSAVKKVEEIAVGQFIDYEVGGGTQILNFPDTTSEDVRFLATSMGTSVVLPEHFQSTSGAKNGSTAEAPPKHARSTPEAPPKHAGSTAEAPPLTMDFTDMRIKEMYQNGASKRQIIIKLFGTKGGPKYQEAAKRVASVIDKVEGNQP